MYAIIYNLLHCHMGESMRTRLLFDSRVSCGQKLTFFIATKQESLGNRLIKYLFSVEGFFD